MPVILLVGGAAATGWLAGLFTSDGLAKVLQLLVILAAAVGLFYAYRVTAKG